MPEGISGSGEQDTGYLIWYVLVFGWLPFRQLRGGEARGGQNVNLANECVCVCVVKVCHDMDHKMMIYSGGGRGGGGVQDISGACE